MKVGLHHSSVGKAQATKNDKVHKFSEKQRKSTVPTEFRAGFIEENLESLFEKRRNNHSFHHHISHFLIKTVKHA